MNVSAFVFGEWIGPAVFYAEVPPKIKSENDLLRLLGTVLDFPGYYGVNWDAFNDCIRHFTWLPKGNIVIKHNDLPLEHDNQAAQIYLDILWEAVAKWLEDEERSLVVVFPVLLRSKVISKIVEKDYMFSHYFRPYPESLIAP